MAPGRGREGAPESGDSGALSSLLARSSAPPVVLLEAHGLAGTLTEDVRAVVLPVVVAGHGVHRGAGLLGRLDRDVPVAADARTRRDQLSDDHVLLEPEQAVALALVAASVSTLVVSWKEAADSHDSVASEAFVMPMSTGRAEAGSPPSATTRRFSVSNSVRSTSAPGRNSVAPESMMVTRFSIWRMITSMCLSWIDTPWLR